MTTTVPSAFDPNVMIPAQGVYVHKWDKPASDMTCDHFGHKVNADVYFNGEWIFCVAVDSDMGHTCPTAEWMTTLNRIIEMEDKS